MGGGGGGVRGDKTAIEGNVYSNYEFKEYQLQDQTSL